MSDASKPAGNSVIIGDSGSGAVDPLISQEGLRKAEAYVQQEEGAGNRLLGWTGIAVTAIAISMSLFHLYAAYDIVPTQPLRYTHVAFVLVLSFLLFPMAARYRSRITWLDLVGCVLIAPWDFRVKEPPGDERGWVRERYAVLQDRVRELVRSNATK